MAKPTFKGNVKFGLLSFAVRAFAATGDANEGISFNQLHGACQTRINQKRWCSKCDVEVPYGELVKGYEHAKGQYVVVSPDEIEALRPESTRILEILKTYPEDAVPPIYFDKAYFLAPDGPIAAEAFVTIREALRGKIGIGIIPVYQRDHLAAVRALENGIQLHLLKDQSQIRTMAGLDLETLPDAKPQMIKLASSLLDSMYEEQFDIAALEFVDTYKAQVVELIKAKIAGTPLEIPKIEAAKPSAGILEALEASLAAVSASPKKAAKADVAKPAKAKKAKVA